MAENKQNPGAVDQSKVKAEAEALAKPGAQPKPITTDSPSEQAANLATGPVRGPESARVEDISPEDAERRLEDQRAKEFGPGYVRAYKTTGEGGQGRQETTFSARAWDLLGNNKEGWKPLVKEPPEVAKLKGDKADSEAAK